MENNSASISDNLLVLVPELWILKCLAMSPGQIGHK